MLINKLKYLLLVVAAGATWAHAATLTAYRGGEYDGQWHYPNRNTLTVSATCDATDTTADKQATFDFDGKQGKCNGTGVWPKDVLVTNHEYAIKLTPGHKGGQYTVTVLGQQDKFTTTVTVPDSETDTVDYQNNVNVTLGDGRSVQTALITSSHLSFANVTVTPGTYNNAGGTIGAVDNAPTYTVDGMAWDGTKHQWNGLQRGDATLDIIAGADTPPGRYTGTATITLNIE